MLPCDAIRAHTALGAGAAITYFSFQDAYGAVGWVGLAMTGGFLVGAVELAVRDEGRLRVGTDDPEALAEAIQAGRARRSAVDSPS